MRTAIAFIFAPISFGVLVAIFVPSLGFLGIGLTALFGYPLALVLGLPAYIFARKKGLNGLLFYGIAAATFSVILITALVIYPIYAEHDGDLSSLSLAPRIQQMIYVTLGSFFSVLVFWLIARPDRLAKV